MSPFYRILLSIRQADTQADGRTDRDREADTQSAQFSSITRKQQKGSGRVADE